MISSRFDSNFFVSQICKFVEKRQYEFVDLSIDSNEGWVIPALQLHGFFFMGANVTYSISMPTEIKSVAGMDQVTIRELKSSDLDPLLSIVGKSFTNDKENINRFNLDYNFNRVNIAELYRQWFLNCVSGERAKKVIVAEIKKAPIGFIACDTIQLADLGIKIGQVPLNAVCADHRKKGIYKALVSKALKWFVGQGCQFIEIKTQLTTLAPQLIWQYFNGRIVKSEYNFHKWF